MARPARAALAAHAASSGQCSERGFLESADCNAANPTSWTARPCSRNCGAGAASSDFPRSASPASISPPPKPALLAWLDNGFHGAMDYMAAHGLKRARPAELVPGTVRVDHRAHGLPAARHAATTGRRSNGSASAGRSEAAVSLYARGRDYHKVLRARLQQLADRLADAIGPFGHRVFTDSAPVLEVELAARSGLGWRGKHTLALDRDAGSMFFLGEIYVDLALPLTRAGRAALRQLQRLHRRLPDAGDRRARTGSTRGAASPT